MIAILLCACKGNTVDLTQIKTIDHLQYRLQYCPVNLQKESTPVQAADLHYYRLTISEEERSGRKIAELYLQNNYNRLLYYINRSIQQDFKTIAGGEEILPVQVYFESNNRMTHRLVFMLAFEKPIAAEGDLTLEFDDHIFNNGKIKFKYDIKELI